MHDDVGEHRLEVVSASAMARPPAARRTISGNSCSSVVPSPDDGALQGARRHRSFGNGAHIRRNTRMWEVMRPRAMAARPGIRADGARLRAQQLEGCQEAIGAAAFERQFACHLLPAVVQLADQRLGGRSIVEHRLVK